MTAHAAFFVAGWGICFIGAVLVTYEGATWQTDALGILALLSGASAVTWSACGYVSGGR